MTEPAAFLSRPASAPPLTRRETRQLTVLRGLGTAGGLLVLLGAGTAFGASPLSERPALAVGFTGMALVVLCWLLVGRLATPWRTRRLSLRQVHLTLACWAAPLLIAVPLFSRDLYSYLAVGETIRRGIDPYRVGPVDALGASDSIAMLVDPSWVQTPTPYGPAFLLLTQGVSELVGHTIAASILMHRLIAVLGVVLIVWALPRLARMCSFDPVTALWLGALNPLLVFHLIGGAHNEALMMGLLLAGLAVGLQRSAVLGAVLITLAAAVKAPAALALVFLVLALGVKTGGRGRDLARAAAIVLPAAIATFLTVTVLAGWGWGWLAALSAPGTVTSFLSITTQLGGAGTLLLQSFGLAVDSSGVVPVVQKIGLALAAVIIAVLAWRVWRRRLDPVLGLGLGLGAFVALSPTVQQWYLLWAVLPIAAAAVNPRLRLVTTWLSAVVAMLVTPAGTMTSVGAVIPAVLCAAVAVAVVLVTMKRLGLPLTTRTQPDTEPR